MAQKASKEPALPHLEGELAPPPRGPLLTTLLAVTGILLLVELGWLLARYVLVLKRPAEVLLTPTGVEVRGKTLMVGKVLREHDTIIPRQGLVRVTREVLYPRLAMYAGLVALALGSYVGVGLVVDGTRAASPSMLGTGLLIVVIGLGLDFILSSLVPGLQGKSRLVLVPRRGRIVCVTAVARSRADALLAELAKAAPGASDRARSAVDPAGADRTSDDPKEKRAADA